jgi:DNA-binding NarL/FixJ family response regulator
VLVVDDFEQWRRVVRTTLQAKLGLQVLEEAADGLEAVEKAQDLQPDLVVLDIGLPTLNGIEAARQIRRVSPASKIVFFTQNRSADIAREVLTVRACGYVIKSDGTSALLNSIRMVLDGKRFVSGSLGGMNLTDPKQEQACCHGDLEPVREANGKATHRHQVNFFRDDSGFVDGFAGFTGAILGSGSPVVVLATESHRNSIVRKLGQAGIDVGAAVKGRLFTTLDVADSLAKFRLAEDFTEEAAKAAPGNLRVGVG